MGPKPEMLQSGQLFGYPLMEHLNQRHPLIQLAGLIDWDAIDRVGSESFQSKRGGPGVRPRLIAGLLYLQHAYDLSDEEVVWSWVENSYWQVFTGEMRQNYNREAPRLALQVGRYAHARHFKRMRGALRTLRTRVGRVHRDIERQMDKVPEQQQAELKELLCRTRRILTQKPKDKNKLYALHAPEVECIAKGKARTPYEFGVKVSIVTTHKEGLVVGARSMPGNPYDGHTLYEALERAEILSSVKPQMAFVDKGYQGVDIDGVQIWKSGQKRGVTRGLKAMIKRRSAIEPTIGHMKSDGKLGRNWLKGALGDAIHAVLCGAGHNLRLIIRKLRLFCADILRMLLRAFQMSALAG